MATQCAPRTQRLVAVVCAFFFVVVVFAPRFLFPKPVHTVFLPEASKFIEMLRSKAKKERKESPPPFAVISLGATLWLIVVWRCATQFSLLSVGALIHIFCTHFYFLLISAPGGIGCCWVSAVELFVLSMCFSLFYCFIKYSCVSSQMRQTLSAQALWWNLAVEFGI